MKVAFLGLGHMGKEMARALLEARHDVAVYNRSEGPALELARAGARQALAPAEAVKEAEAVVTMLADDRAVESVVLDGGVPYAMPAGAVHVSMSTISVELSRRLSKLHAERGQGYVAAPVFGRPDTAAARKLFVVAAGGAQDVQRVRPLLDAVGQGVTVLGEDAPLANVVKLSGNFLIAAMIEALGQTFALVRKAGLDQAAYLKMLNTVFFQSPILSRYAGIIAEGQYEPAGFKLLLGLKDLRLVLEAAEGLAVPLPLASLVHDDLLTAVAHGAGERDWAALAQVSADRAGLS